MEPEAPGAVEPPISRILPILAIVPGVSALFRWANGDPLLGDPAAGAIAALSAGTLGVPMLFWSLSRGRSSLERWLVLGLIGGAIPLVLFVLCGVAGLTLRHGSSDMMYVVRRGAPLPWFGQVTWLQFSGFVTWSAFVGAVSATIHWALLVTPERRRGAAIAAVTVGVGTAAVWWLR